MTDRPTSGPAPRWGEYAPTPQEPPQPPLAAEPPRPEPEPAPRPVARAVPTWDRVVTIGLLALGVLNVLTGIPQFLRLPVTLDEVYGMQGFGDYTSDGLASSIGIAINAVSVVLLILAVAVSVARMRAGRLAFWVPLAAGGASVLVTIVLMTVAMVGDPALGAYLEGGVTAP